MGFGADHEVWTNPNRPFIYVLHIYGDLPAPIGIEQQNGEVQGGIERVPIKANKVLNFLHPDVGKIFETLCPHECQLFPRYEPLDVQLQIPRQHVAKFNIHLIRNVEDKKKRMVIATQKYKKDLTIADLRLITP